MKFSTIGLAAAGLASAGAVVAGAAMANASTPLTPALTGYFASGDSTSPSGGSTGSGEGSAQGQNGRCSQGQGEGRDGRGGGGAQDTPVTGDEATRAGNAVTAKDSAFTVESVRKDPDGSYDVFGTKNDRRAMYDVSADLATVSQAHGGLGHGGRGDRGPGGQSADGAQRGGSGSTSGPTSGGTAS